MMRDAFMMGMDDAHKQFSKQAEDCWLLDWFEHPCLLLLLDIDLPMPATNQQIPQCTK